MNCVLVRYGEIGTKSKRTRKRWERILMRNIQNALRSNNIEFSSIYNPRGRIVVCTQNEKTLTALKNVFGISSVSFAKKIGRGVKIMKEEALHFYECNMRSGQTFRISTQRLDKQFPLTSQEVNAAVGAFITEHSCAQVDLDNPDVDICIEILQNAAYIFVGRKPGYGGIPVGVQGKVLVNLKDRRSVVAAWMMLKRGCDVIAYGNAALVPYLEPFSYGHPIQYISSPTKARNYLAIVLSELKLEKREIPSLYPLLGLDEQQIQEIEILILGKA
jgi:thiamine biosynthesis protein ThiI